MKMLTFPFCQNSTAGGEVKQPSIPYMVFGTGRHLSFHLAIRPFSL